MRLFSFGARPAVVVATRSPQLPAIRAALRRCDPQLPCREALSTAGALQQLEGAGLVIADLAGPDAVLEDGVSVDALQRAAAARHIAVVAPAEFLAEPARWVQRARAARGEIAALEPRAIAFANTAGGVGKTTLAIASARLFAARARLPVALLEFTNGASAFRLRLDPGLPTLHQVVTGTHAPAERDGLVAIAMDPELDQHLRPDDLLAWFARFRQAHLLLVCDAALPNPLFDALAPELDQVLVVANPRPEAVQSAERCAALLRRRLEPAPPAAPDGVASPGPAPAERVALVLNQARAGHALAYRAVQPALVLPFDGRAEHDARPLARRLLGWLYPTVRW